MLWEFWLVLFLGFDIADEPLSTFVRVCTTRNFYQRGIIGKNYEPNSQHAENLKLIENPKKEDKSLSNQFTFKSNKTSFI